MFLTAATATVGLYAIFLVPDPADETFVFTDLLIDSLAEEFGNHTGGSKFSPHLPLLADIRVRPAELIAPLLHSIQEAAREVEPFNVTFAADPLHSFPTWQQGMVAFVDENDKLKAAQEKFTHVVEGHTVPTEWKAPAGHPHMPLLFGALEGNTTASVVAKVQERAPWLLAQRTALFTAAQLWAVMPMLSEVPEWKLMATVHLGNVTQRTLSSNSSNSSNSSEAPAKKTLTQHEHAANKSAQKAPHAATAKTQQQKEKPAAKAHAEKKPVQGHHHKKPGGAATHASSGAPDAKANAKAFASAHASAGSGK